MYICGVLGNSHSGWASVIYGSYNYSSCNSQKKCPNNLMRSTLIIIPGGSIALPPLNNTLYCFSLSVTCKTETMEMHLYVLAANYNSSTLIPVFQDVKWHTGMVVYPNQ